MKQTPRANQGSRREELDLIRDRLARVMEPDQARRWLDQPNAAFDGATPSEVVGRGERDRVWRMLYDLESGQPG